MKFSRVFGADKLREERWGLRAGFEGASRGEYLLFFWGYVYVGVLGGVREGYG